MKDVKVGDVLAGSWGYSMTLWMFGEVVKVTPKQVVIRELMKQDIGGQLWELEVKPVLGKYDTRHPDTEHRVKNDIDKDYVWIPKYRCLLYHYDPNKKFLENHMD